ncbi:MAG: molybdopterin dinucleotide binding domain-containing protein [Sterolibacterium sp.]
MGYPPLPFYEEAPETPVSAPQIARDFPLVLTTGGRIPSFFNSEGRQLAKLRRLQPDPITEMHPETAAKLDIAEGDWIWIETLRGRIKQRAKLIGGMDPRVVSSQHGWWFPEEKGAEHGIWQSNVNVLTNTEAPHDPAMGTYQLRALLCRVSLAERAVT